MEFNRRRLLIAISPFAALGAARLILRSSSTATAATYVEVIPFDDSGRPQPRQRLPRVDRTDAEWKSRLSAEQFYVTRRGTTDTPFTGTYYKLHDPGMFRCVCCGNAAFTSETKYDSGTGWPSFWDVAAPEHHASPGRRSRGSPLHSLRRPLGTRFRRWSRADSPALLHQRVRVTLRAEPLIAFLPSHRDPVRPHCHRSGLF